MSDLPLDSTPNTLDPTSKMSKTLAESLAEEQKHAKSKSGASKKQTRMLRIYRPNGNHCHIALDDGGRYNNIFFCFKFRAITGIFLYTLTN